MRSDTQAGRGIGFERSESWTRSGREAMDQRDFASLFASLQFDESPHFSPARVMSLLGVKRRELARICRLRPERFRQSPLSPGVQDSLRELIRVLGAAHGRFEDEQHLAFWFKNCPIARCGFRTPAELCAQGRAGELLELLAVDPD